MLLPKVVVEKLVEQLPEHHQASQEVVEALRVKLSILIHRVRQLMEQEAWVQSASYMNAIAELVVGNMSLNRSLPIHLPACSIPLLRYNPMVVLEKAVLLEMEANVSFLLA